MTEPKPHEVKEWLTPFAWVDHSDVVHFNIELMLRGCGLPNTQENHDMAIEEAQRMVRRLYPEVQFFVRKADSNGNFHPFPN